MTRHEWRQSLIGLVIAALIAGVLLAAAVAGAADEVVLGAAISQTGT